MRVASLLALSLVAACGSSAGDGTLVIDTPPNTWTWVEVPGTTCGNGTPAGIGVNRGTDGGGLFVYFEGGGACWDANTCFTITSAINLDVTYDAAKLATDVAGLVVDRAAANPFGAATYVYVPYCTGDVHAGESVHSYVVDGAPRSVHHTGALNTQRFVDALAASFPDAPTVWLAGSSAGGYGATFALRHVADAWPDAGVHLLQDSAPFVPVLANYRTWQDAWLIDFPPGCTGCETDFSNVINAVATAHPTSRIGLLTYDDDAVVKAFFGYSGSLAPAIDKLLADQYARPTTHAFVVAGTAHTMLGELGTLVGPGGVHLSSWVTQWATGDAGWSTVRP